MFERSLADKLNFYDWKLSFSGTPEDFEIFHKKS
jgi:hypothetical protein